MKKTPFFLLCLFFSACSQSTEVEELEEIPLSEVVEMVEVESEAEVEEQSQLEVQLGKDEELISPYIIRKITCEDERCWYRKASFLDLEGNVYPVPAGTVNNAGDGWVYMDSANQIFTYDVFTSESQLLMSVLDTTDGVSYLWSPDDLKLAVVVINQQDETYRETYGSKLFMFSFDSEGVMTRKDRYLYKIKYGCHDAGCDSTAGEDFYFEDNDTFIFYTWDDDPYLERTEEFKRTVEL